MECAAGDCIQPPDGDDEAEPDMEEIDGDGSEEIEDSEDDLPEGEREYEVETDSEPESEGWDIDPDDVVIGEECPQDGIRLCVGQVLVECGNTIGWGIVVNCASDGSECWNADCINPGNPDYPGCTDGGRRCVGTVLQECTSEAEARAAALAASKHTGNNQRRLQRDSGDEKAWIPERDYFGGNE